MATGRAGANFNSDYFLNQPTRNSLPNESIVVEEDQLLENKSSPTLSAIELTETGVSNLNTLRETIIDQETNERQVSKDFLHKIGRWGEHWVNEMLKIRYKKELEDGEIKIEWMNEISETGYPFDFRLTFQQSEDPVQEENESLSNFKFIEVKSTIKECKEAFPISYQELFFAQKYSSQFEIYRVYNAANVEMSAVSFKIIKDIPHLLNTHGINLFIVI